MGSDTENGKQKHTSQQNINNNTKYTFLISINMIIMHNKHKRYFN